jgi:glycosyltransferase involved in cell wall biosynthesis
MKALRGKILILVENLSVPFDQRVWREATALAEAGCQVSVICPKGEQFDQAAHEVIDDVRIYRYSAFEAKEGLASYFGEFLQALVMMSLLSVRVFFREGFHVIQTCNPPDLLFLVTLPYKLLGRKVIFDHHDLSPETYQTKRESEESNFVHKLLLFFERMTFRTADVVMSTNESYKRVAMDRGGVAEADVVVVRNGPDLNRVREAPPNPELKQGKRHLVFYIGTMGSQDGVDYLLRATKHLGLDRGRDDFHTLIMGGGIELDNLKAYAAELGIEDRVTFTGRVPDEEVVEALNTADVCVCPDPKTPLNDVSTMNKTMEYMALGKAVAAFDLRETRVSAEDAALYAEGNDDKDLADKIARLLDDADLREQLGAVGRQRIDERLSWEHQKVALYRAYRLAFQKAGKPACAPPDCKRS